MPRGPLGVPGGLRPAGGPSWSDDPAAAAAAAPSRPSALLPRSRSLYYPFSVVASVISGPTQDRLSPSGPTGMLGLLRPRAESASERALPPGP